MFYEFENMVPLLVSFQMDSSHLQLTQDREIYVYVGISQFLKLWLNPSMNISQTSECVDLIIAWMVLLLPNNYAIQIFWWLFSLVTHITLLFLSTWVLNVLVCMICVNYKTYLIYSLLWQLEDWVRFTVKLWKDPMSWLFVTHNSFRIMQSVCISYFSCSQLFCCFDLYF